MKKIFFVALAILLFTNVGVRAQGCAADTVYRWINNQKVTLTNSERQNGIQLSCDEPSATFIPSVFCPGDPAGGYTYESIPYNPPFAFNSGYEVVLPKDDCWSKQFSLSYNNPTPPGVPPFSFYFYDRDYTGVSVSSNCNLHFIRGAADITNYVTPETATSAGDYKYCPYSYSAAFPDSRTMMSSYANPTLNGVSGPFHDIYFGGNSQYPGHMYFQVVGEYPCRKIVLSYYQVPLYGNTSLLATHMMVLYETTNVIEFYLKDKPKETSTNDGKAVLGIQNHDGTQACAITNNGNGVSYNNTVWEAYNEAWRIKPTGQLAFDLNWYKRTTQGPQQGQMQGPLPTDADFKVVAQPTFDEGPTWYIAKATIYRMDGEEFEVYDSVLVKPYDIRPTKVFHKSAVNPNAVANANYIDTVCKGELVQFNLEGADAYYIEEPAIYANNQIVDSAVTLTNIANQDEVFYKFRFENYENGQLICTRYDSCLIRNYSFEIDLGADTTICQGESVVYSDLLLQDSGSYAWSTGATTAQLNYQPQQTEQITLTVTNPIGCTATDNATAVVNQAPNVNIVGNFQICNGTTTTLTAQSNLGNCVYEWNTGETTPTITVSPTQTTKYTVSVKFPPAMCETIVDQIVEVKNAPLINCNQDQNICYGETAQVMVVSNDTEPLRYEWQSVDASVNGSNATNFIVSPSGTTHYIVTAYNDFNCNSTDEVVIFVEQKPVPVITFSPKAIDALTPIVVFTDSTQGNVSTLWEISDGSSSTDRVFVHTFDVQDGVVSYDVTLTAETEFGCIDSVTNIIRVKREHHLYAPTGVYIHDNNVSNRTFRLHIDNLIEYNLKIFNRWGTLMFETNDIEETWDCTYEGKNVEQGVYVWKAVYRHNDSPNREQVESGNFMIYN
ncbi:MAG: gliding motility-associated C-terminal domain-containing protein [Bacteroidales bacterium]|nr:gliding motility-associated C-terminal domain-containing protein [Bacteroidales bacterium]